MRKKKIYFRYEMESHDQIVDAIDIITFEICELHNTGVLLYLATKWSQSVKMTRKLEQFAKRIVETEEDLDASKIRPLIEEALSSVRLRTGTCCNYAIWLAALPTVVNSYVRLGEGGKLLGYLEGEVLDSVENSVMLHAYQELPQPRITIDLSENPYCKCQSKDEILRHLHEAIVNAPYPKTQLFD